MVVSDQGREDIKWWIAHAQNLCKDFSHVDWAMTITTDASKLGWGAVSPNGNN